MAQCLFGCFEFLGFSGLQRWQRSIRSGVGAKADLENVENCDHCTVAAEVLEPCSAPAATLEAKRVRKRDILRQKMFGWVGARRQLASCGDAMAETKVETVNLCVAEPVAACSAGASLPDATHDRKSDMDLQKKIGSLGNRQRGHFVMGEDPSAETDPGAVNVYRSDLAALAKSPAACSTGAWIPKARLVRKFHMSPPKVFGWVIGAGHHRQVAMLTMPSQMH
eukprot:TRINITY_DN13941_c0_g1_i2.p1 TRINITY_DN13941_c0_g1~~TRINITY_DN13941_c0_g1_i2.p1  ORF type:complete len:235 (-),score=37.25 TRINITY_DN13941_c0_g1_i2:646-1314(-)